MLGSGILFTARGMGCLSTPMSSAEIDAFVESTRLGLGELGIVESRRATSIACGSRTVEGFRLAVVARPHPERMERPERNTGA